MSNQPTYRRKVLDHLGLVAGMYDELGIGEVLDQATHHNPDMRDLPVGEAVKAMVLNGLGFIALLGPQILLEQAHLSTHCPPGFPATAQ